MTTIRSGIGYDIHPLVPGRKLVLGGETIPFSMGLDGWSDADVLVHAVIDSLLGAAALGDIGQHFPAGKAEYKDISSLILLRETVRVVSSQGFRIVNIDVTAIAEKPVLKDYIIKMRENLAGAMGLDVEQVSMKASTANGVGEIGKVEAIAAIAVSMIEGEN